MHQFLQRMRGLVPGFAPTPAKSVKDAAFRTLTSADFQLLTEKSIDTLCRVGPDFRIRYTSHDALRLLGRTPLELLGKRPDAFMASEDLPLVAATMASDLADRAEPAATAVRIRHRDGTSKWISLTCRALRDAAAGPAEETVLVMRDIPDRKGLEQRLAALPPGDGDVGLVDRHAFDHALRALTDDTTGLANRRAFDTALQLGWNRARRNEEPMSLLLLHVDGLQAFRDRFGDQSGDRCLRAVAALVTAAGRRAYDQAAHFAGDELALILPDTHAGGAATVAETIRGAVHAMRLSHAGGPAAGSQFTTSVAAATAGSCRGTTMSTPSILLMAADAALVQAKTSGQNRVVAAVLHTQEAKFQAAPLEARAASRENGPGSQSPETLTYTRRDRESP